MGLTNKSGIKIKKCSDDESLPLILHLLTSNSLSGAENVAIEIINNTNKDDYRTIYCSPDGNISKHLLDQGIDFLPFKKISISSLSKIIKDYKPAIIHAHDFKASIIASFFSRNIKVISHIHQNPKWMHNKLSLRAHIYKFVSNRFYKIILVSKFINNSFVFRNNDKTVAITNFVDPDVISKKSLEYDVDNVDIIYCGRLEPVKNPIKFIKIIKDIRDDYNKNITSYIVGDGSQKSECLELIDKFKLKDNIKLVGFQTNPYPYIKASKYLFLTSNSEGCYPMVAIEAKLLGVKVLLNRLDSFSNLVPEQYLCDSISDFSIKYNANENQPSYAQKTKEERRLEIAELYDDKK